VGSDSAFHAGSRSSAGRAAIFVTLFAVLLYFAEYLVARVRHPDLLGTSGKDESAPVNLMLPSSTLNVGSVGQISSGPSSADRPQNLGAISSIVTGISQAIGEIDAPHVDAALLDAFLD
jgi:hypothetical protein